ncbi:actin-7-related [Anaeramoeba ignava]|uniref:Actin-7-related n=1 Tax=Anaeramoeba ignava TaxID=1746090 RepID=A0A9Q0LUS5_ANAIG|nr:actin-7-related [Anaeramoeba ignava]
MINFEDFNQEYQPLVIDNGSGMIKAGFAGDDAPRSIFPSISIKPRFYNPLITNEKPKFLGGDEPQINREIMKINYPLENGIISNWDDMEKIWHNVFYNELRVSPEEHPVLLTQIPFNPNSNKEKTAQIMFETFNVPGFYIANDLCLSIFLSGKETGIVIDLGDSISHSGVVYQLNILPHSVQRINFGGKHLTEYLTKIVNEKGFSFTSKLSDVEIIKDLKEKFCYVALDFEEEMVLEKQNIEKIQKNYELLDGKFIQVSNERFKIPEILFNPNLLGLETYGIHNSIYKSIMSCDLELHDSLFDNIVLSGGSSMFPGIEERLQKEFSFLVKNQNFQIVSPSERKYSVWIGGSILASLSTFRNSWILKEEYEENGIKIIYQKLN